MERLTLEEAIKHAKEVAKSNRAEATYNFPTLGQYYDNCLEYAEQHEQLAKWLEELKSYKSAEEQGLLVRLPCKFGDTVWELCQCEDGIYRIFPMTVKAVSEFGTLRQTEGMPTVWNIYAESDYTYSYKTFGDIGKSVFLTREEAEKKL